MWTRISLAEPDRFRPDRSYSLHQKKVHMLKNTRLQMIVMMGISGFLGYAAASGKLDVFRRASAEPPQQLQSEKESSLIKTAEATCCSEGTSKGQLVAMLDPRAPGPRAKAEAEGKKPNIVFIMG